MNVFELLEKKMDEENDDRFAAISHDPRFRKLNQKERKVKIDKRFHGMFKDDSFRLKYTVDKRGRPVNLTSDKHLRKFYELSSSSDSEDEKSDSDDEIRPMSEDHAEGRSALRKCRRLSGKKQIKELLRKRREKRERRTESKLKNKFGTRRKQDKSYQDKRQGNVEDSNQDSSKDELSVPTVSNRKHKGQAFAPTRGVDLARGQGNVESSSDSDSDYGSEREGEEIELQWGELDSDALRSSNQSARLALCNMDWDRVSASDLLVLFNSFKTTGGVIHSVKIYPSEYGLKKLREEDARGPVELLKDNSKDEKKEAGREDEDLLQEKLRKYQLQRLKYYYAVIDCDTPETGLALYDHCDGLEYQSSSTKLDLRFIPDDVTFDHEPKEVATDLPDTAHYQPAEFRTKALHQSRVELTWDETDHQRTVKTAEAFKKKNVEDMDVSAFLASSSDEEDGEQWELDFSGKDKTRPCNSEEKCNVSMNEDQQIAKYRALLKEANGNHQTETDKQMEMEITWEPGLKDSAEELVKRKFEKSADSTPWEKFMEKKKEKKKKQKTLKKEEEIKEPNPNTELAFSDDELPLGVDLNDSFFKDMLKEDGVKGSKKSKKLKGKHEDAGEDKEEVHQKKSELELLFMDNDDGKKHFNLKRIMENEEQTSKTKRKKKRKQLEEAAASKYEDDFEIDVTDYRFQAMFSSHLYAMDPSDPQFKKTKATEALLAERQKRIQRNATREATPKLTPTATPKKALKASNKDVALSMLIKSVKMKTEQFNESKLKRQKVK